MGGPQGPGKTSGLDGAGLQLLLFAVAVIVVVVVENVISGLFSPLRANCVSEKVRSLSES